MENTFEEIQKLHEAIEEAGDYLFKSEVLFLLEEKANGTSPDEEIKRMAAHHAYAVLMNLRAMEAAVGLYEKNHGGDYSKAIAEVYERVMDLTDEIECIDIFQIDEEVETKGGKQ